jgi:hypothetical protein
MYSQTPRDRLDIEMVGHLHNLALASFVEGTSNVQSLAGSAVAADVALVHEDGDLRNGTDNSPPKSQGK